MSATRDERLVLGGRKGAMNRWADHMPRNLCLDGLTDDEKRFVVGYVRSLIARHVVEGPTGVPPYDLPADIARVRRGEAPHDPIAWDAARYTR